MDTWQGSGEAGWARTQALTSSPGSNSVTAAHWLLGSEGVFGVSVSQFLHLPHEDNNGICLSDSVLLRRLNEARHGKPWVQGGLGEMLSPGGDVLPPLHTAELPPGEQI